MNEPWLLNIKLFRINSLNNPETFMYQLRKINESHIEETLQLLAQTIGKGEPMSKVLKTSPSIFKQVYRQEIETACKMDYSYGYFLDNKMVSVCITMPYLDYMKLPKSQYEESPQIAPKKALHKIIHKDYQPPQPNKTLMMVWGTVDFKHLKHGFYEKLSLIAEEAARKKGFEDSIGIASNISSQRISMEKLKYQPVYKYRYSDFMYEGKHIFEQIKDQSNTEYIVVGLKKLEPAAKL